VSTRARFVAPRGGPARVLRVFVEFQVSLELPPDGCPVDLDHDGRKIGEVVHAKLRCDDRLPVVAVIDGLELDRAEQPVYFSPMMMMMMIGDGVHERSYVARKAELLGLSLTFATRRVAPRPIEWLPGDVRIAADRGSWPFSTLRIPWIERAAQLERRHKAERILDLRERSDATADLQYEGPRGRLQYVAPGRILSVR
jgi:hypothetical protein